MLNDRELRLDLVKKTSKQLVWEMVGEKEEKEEAEAEVVVVVEEVMKVKSSQKI